MGDPLSIPAGIAGLLTLAGSIIPKGYALYGKIKRRAEDVKVLMNEVTSLSGLLFGLQAHTDLGTKDPNSPMLQGLSESGTRWSDTIKDCRQLLSEIASLLDDIAKERPLRLMVNMDFITDRAGELVAKLERYKTFFILFFQVEDHTAEMVTLLREIKSDQRRLHDHFQEVEDAKKDADFLKWLGQVTKTEHEDASRYRSATSGQWLLARPEFGTWLSAEASSFFWLNGIQGSGKTVLISAIINTLQDIYGDDEDTSQAIIAYHYCRFSAASPVSSEKLIGALASQVLQQHPHRDTAMRSAFALFEQQRSKNRYPTLQAMTEFFQQITELIPMTFLIVDGLDEVADRDGIVSFLEDVATWNGNFKILVASRKESDLEHAFEYFNCVTISPSDVAGDIESYVRSRVSKFRWSGISELDDIVQELVNRADGMFLWVVCQLDQLSRIRTAISKDTLQTLPKGLGRTFQAILQQLEEEDKHLAKRILQFVACSPHPLDLDELVEVIAIEPHVRSFKTLRKNKLLRASDIFDICGSLIHRSQVTGKITLCHYSVHEFLATPTLESGQKNEFFINTSQAGIDLAIACVTYLNFDDFSTRKFCSAVTSSTEARSSQADDRTSFESPFLHYAANNWWHYLAAAGKSGLEEAWPILEQFFSEDRGNFEYWTDIAAYVHGAYRYPSGLRPLHVAAIHGLHDLASLLLKANPEASGLAAGDGRTSLHFALQNGQNEMVDYLIRTGAPVEAKDDSGRRPLHLAMELGNEEAVQMLVAAGAGVNAAQPDGRTPITIAIENRCDDLLDSLMGSIMNTRLPDGRSLLHLAAQAGNERFTFRLINGCDGDVNERDQSDWTPLHYSADQGHQGVIKTLLRNNAFVSPCDKNGWTPLHAAIRGRHGECVTLLLQADGPRSDNSVGRRRVAHASGSRNETPYSERVRKDDQYGPHQRQGGEVKSPLLLAVKDGYSEGVKLLLDHASDGEYYGDIKESLDVAQKSNDMDILKALIPKARVADILAILDSVVDGANEEVLLSVRERLQHRSELYSEVLPDAIDKGRLAVVQFALATPAPLGCKQSLDTLFAHAVRENFVAAARLLLMKGASIAVADKKGRTPLLVAIMAEKYDAARFLLKVTDAKSLAARTKNGETALHVLADRRFKGADAAGWIEVADLLADAGVDVSAMDEGKQQICHKAAANNNLSMMQWALQKGLDPEKADVDGTTAIHLAVKHSHLETARFLLSRLREEPGTALRLMAGDGGTGTPLALAARTGKIEALSMLLEFEHQVSQALCDDDQPSGWPVAHRTEAMCVAASEGFLEGTSLFLDAAADVSRENSEGATALHAASKHGHDAVVSLLLSRGADVDETTLRSITTSKYGKTRVMAAILQSLLDRGKEISVAVRVATLHRAIEAGNMSLIHMVLADGTDILCQAAGQKDAEGRTILHMAVKQKQTDVVAQILEAGIDRACIDATDADGATALTIAVRQDTDDIRDLLLQGGASVESTLAWAKSKHKFQLIVFLRSFARQKTSD